MTNQNLLKASPVNQINSSTLQLSNVSIISMVSCSFQLFNPFFDIIITLFSDLFHYYLIISISVQDMLDPGKGELRLIIYRYRFQVINIEFKFSSVRDADYCRIWDFVKIYCYVRFGSAYSHLQFLQLK